MQLDVGTQVDRYTLEGFVGKGGMAAVYRVRHVQLGTEHALKVLLNTAPSVRERLLHEGRVQAALRHANIVNVTDVIDVGGAPGLIMEYVRGPALSDLLKERRLSVAQVDLLARGILAGVAHAHRRKLIHRDLKPHNVLCQITEDGLVPKVADFGLVKALEGESQALHQTRTGAMMGTPYYMSPEQIRSTKHVDERSDIWALGVILYEMLTGERPFRGADVFEVFTAVNSGTFVAPGDLVPGIPARMERTIARALVVDLEQRLQRTDHLLRLWRGEALEDVEGTLDSHTPSMWDDDLLARFSGDSETSVEPSVGGETWTDGTLDDFGARPTISADDLEDDGAVGAEDDGTVQAEDEAPEPVPEHDTGPTLTAAAATPTEATLDAPSEAPGGTLDAPSALPEGTLDKDGSPYPEPTVAASPEETPRRRGPLVAALIGLAAVVVVVVALVAVLTGLPGGGGEVPTAPVGEQTRPEPEPDPPTEVAEAEAPREAEPAAAPEPPEPEQSTGPEPGSVRSEPASEPVSVDPVEPPGAAEPAPAVVATPRPAPAPAGTTDEPATEPVPEPEAPAGTEAGTVAAEPEPAPEPTPEPISEPPPPPPTTWEWRGDVSVVNLLSADGAWSFGEHRTAVEVAPGTWEARVELEDGTPITVSPLQIRDGAHHVLNCSNASRTCLLEGP